MIRILSLIAVTVFLGTVLGVCGPLSGALAVSAAQQEANPEPLSVNLRSNNAALIWERSRIEGWQRTFMEDFPKGADLHNHLTGAIYAETYLEWAVEDGLCVDLNLYALRDPGEAACEDLGFVKASMVQSNDVDRRNLINSLSNRSFFPTNAYSGHNDFFDTFARMARKPYRLGDMLAAAVERAAAQNIVYLELMETPVLGELFGVVPTLELTGDVEKDAALIRASAVGDAFEGWVEKANQSITDAYDRMAMLLKCGTPEAKPGCGVKVRLLYQVIRELPPENVFTQFMLAWRVMAEHPMVLGVNLVAPEDGHVALRDYTYHMEMIDYLYRTQGAHNVSLHAGELTLGLVRPKQLRFHIREAIEIGHAKRIGHGIDIPFEEDAIGLMEKMAKEGIMVEINLTSNETILGVAGEDHPFALYRRFGVPMAISTDDEGVSRIDLTHEYIKAVEDQGLRYSDLKELSRNSLTYSFLPGASLWDIDACAMLKSGGEPDDQCKEAVKASEKAMTQWQLEQAYRKFEKEVRVPSAPVRIY